MTRVPGSHLTYSERCQISVCLRNDYSQAKTAAFVGITQSVVFREVKRNSVNGVYEPEQAQKNYELRRSVASSVPRKINDELAEKIRDMLKDTDSSPEQIAGRLKIRDRVSISHEGIYLWIWKDKKQGGELYKRLRHRHKPYHKRSSKKAGRGQIPNRVGIENRPAIVEDKSRFGDLELDTIVGAQHQGSIISAVDRASKVTWLEKANRATAKHIQQSLCERLKDFAKKDLLKTLTSDNGREFARHQEMAQALNCSHYFANPYSSWERGLNEHTNGLVRQYLPKKTSFASVTQRELTAIEYKLNNRPRKCLGYLTPYEHASMLIGAENLQALL